MTCTIGMRIWYRYPDHLAFRNDLTVGRSVEQRRRDTSCTQRNGQIRTARVQAVIASNMQMTVARKIIELKSGGITMLNMTRRQHKVALPCAVDRKVISPGEYFDYQD